MTNFRGIKKGELSLSPLTILLGANNSGKTTILEALFLAPNPFRKVPYLVGNSMAVEAINSLHETLSSKGYAFLLHNYTADEARIECVVNGRSHLLQLIKANSRICVKTKEMREYTTLRFLDKEISCFGHMNISASDIVVVDSNLFTQNALLISPRLINIGYNYMEKNWASIINLGICKRVAEETSKLSYDEYKDITIEPFLGGSIAIYAYFEDGRRIRLGDLGEGIQNYMLARILYEVEKANILLWDDIEAHFNPRIIISIADWFSDLLEEGKQIIVTTHSIEAARMIASFSEDKAGIYLTSLEDRVIKTKKRTLKEVEELLEAGIDMRMAEPLLL
jgi:AAA15 family ATPase/GTPase